MQGVSMLDQPCPTQSERPESAVPAASPHRSWPQAAYAFEVRSAWRPPVRGPEPAMSAMGAVTVVQDRCVWLPVDVSAASLDQLSIVLHLSRIEGTQPGGATWL